MAIEEVQVSRPPTLPYKTKDVLLAVHTAHSHAMMLDAEAEEQGLAEEAAVEAYLE